MKKTNPDQFPFRQRLAAGFLVVLLALAGLMISFYENNEDFITTAERTTHTNHVLYQSEQVISLVKDVETGTRGFLLSGDRRFLEPYFLRSDNVYAHLDTLRQLTADNKLQQNRIVVVSDLIKKRVALSEQQIEIRKREGVVVPAIIDLSRKGLVLMDSVRHAIDAIQDEEQRHLVLRQEANREATRSTRVSIFIIGAVMAALLVAGWLVIMRNLKARAKSEAQIRELNESLEKKIIERSEAFTRAEQLLTHTLDNMIEGVQIIDFDWKYIYVNDALIKQSRYTRDEMIGRKVADLYPGVESSELFDVLKQCMMERIPIALQTEFRFPDRTSDWFELNFQPVPDGIFILSTVTTRQREAARQITEQKALAESLLLAAPDGIIGIDEKGSITLINHQAESIFGYVQQEIIGHTIEQLIPREAAEIYKTVSESTQKQPAVHKREMTGQRKNGQRFPLDVSWSFLQTANSRTVIGLFRDITEKKRVEEEIKNLTENLEATVRKRTAELEASNKELDSFSYSVSHDLRAPLRAIDGYTRILAEEYGSKVGEQGRNTMEVIRRNARRMGQLIDDLLAFSRLGKQSLVTATVDMDALMRSAAGEYQERYPEHLQFIIHNLPSVQGDASMLKQAVANLVSNAVKYSSKKENAVVEIGSYSEGDKQIYYVKDNGAGFDMLYYDKLFGVFQRLHSTRDFEGTGVGLAIVQRIIRRHGGDVWAEAKENEGAVFYFSLSKTI